MSRGAWVLVVVLALTTGFGTWRLACDGRFRGTRTLTRTLPRTQTGEPGPVDASPMDEVGLELGERATLLQFSSAFCAPCRVTRRVLGLMLDAEGVVVSRASGAPSRDSVLATLGRVMEP